MSWHCIYPPYLLLLMTDWQWLTVRELIETWNLSPDATEHERASVLCCMRSWCPGCDESSVAERWSWSQDLWHRCVNQGPALSSLTYLGCSTCSCWCHASSCSPWSYCPPCATCPMLPCSSCSPRVTYFLQSSYLPISSFTHPLKKGLDKKINIRLLTPVFIIIYQAEHNLWCPGNVGWENFA